MKLRAFRADLHAVTSPAGFTYIAKDGVFDVSGEGAAFLLSNGYAAGEAVDDPAASPPQPAEQQEPGPQREADENHETSDERAAIIAKLVELGVRVDRRVSTAKLAEILAQHIEPETTQHIEPGTVPQND